MAFIDNIKPPCKCPLCGGNLGFMTFSRLFRCTNCDQHFGEDKAKYIPNGPNFIKAADRYDKENSHSCLSLRR